MCIVEAHYFNRDAGEPNIDTSEHWQVDDEPDVCVPDTWARGQIVTNTSRSVVSTPLFISRPASLYTNCSGAENLDDDVERRKRNLANMLAKLFAIADADSSRKLEIDEFLMAMRPKLESLGLTESEMSELFRLADMNQDGGIDIQEFQSLICNLPFFVRLVEDGVTVDTLLAADDGCIKNDKLDDSLDLDSASAHAATEVEAPELKDEAAEMVLASRASEIENRKVALSRLILNIFTAADSDGSNKLELDEFLMVMGPKLAEFGLNEEEATTLFKFADINRDGGIDQEEFITLIYNLPGFVSLLNSDVAVTDISAKVNSTPEVRVPTKGPLTGSYAASSNPTTDVLQPSAGVSEYIYHESGTKRIAVRRVNPKQLPTHKVNPTVQVGAAQVTSRPQGAPSQINFTAGKTRRRPSPPSGGKGVGITRTTEKPGFSRAGRVVVTRKAAPLPGMSGTVRVTKQLPIAPVSGDVSQKASPTRT